MASTETARRSNRVSEPPVLWLPTTEPSQAFSRHLKTHGLRLSLREQASTLPPARVSWLELALPNGVPRLTLARRRIALLHSDSAQADPLAHVLRTLAAEVIVLGPDPEQLERVARFDPDALLVEQSQFYDSCWSVVQTLWRHARLRWTPLLVAPDAALSETLSAQNTQPLCHAVQSLCADLDDVTALATQSQAFEMSLSALGPARTLRALLATKRVLRASFITHRGRVDVDLAKQQVAGARAYRGSDETDALEGREALAWLLTEARGTVHVSAVERPLLDNIMAPLDRASRPKRAVAPPPPSAHTTSTRTKPPDSAAPAFNAHEVHTSAGSSGVRAAVRVAPAPTALPSAHESLPRFDDDDLDSPTVRLSAEALAEVMAGIHPRTEVSSQPPSAIAEQAPSLFAPTARSNSSVPPPLARRELALVRATEPPTVGKQAPSNNLFAAAAELDQRPPTLLSKPSLPSARVRSSWGLIAAVLVVMLIAGTTAWYLKLAPKELTERLASQLAPAAELLEGARSELWSPAEIRQALSELGAWTKERGEILVAKYANKL